MAKLAEYASEKQAFNFEKKCQYIEKNEKTDQS